MFDAHLAAKPNTETVQFAVQCASTGDLGDDCRGTDWKIRQFDWFSDPLIHDSDSCRSEYALYAIVKVSR